MLFCKEHWHIFSLKQIIYVDNSIDWSIKMFICDMEDKIYIYIYWYIDFVALIYQVVGMVSASVLTFYKILAYFANDYLEAWELIGSEDNVI